MAKVWRFTVLMVITALLVSGCGAFQASKPVTEPLRVAWSLWEGDYTLLIAQEMGLFAKYGIEVEPVQYDAISDVIPDLAGNKIDGGLISLSGLLSTARLADVKGVLVYDAGSTAYIVSHPQIETVADLKGQRVGVLVGTEAELFIRNMILAGGLTMDDVTLVDTEPKYVSQKITSRDIAAGYMVAPRQEEALRQGYKILHAQDPQTVFEPNVVAFRQDILTGRPDDVRGFIKAWFEAVEYRTTHPEEATKIIERLAGPLAVNQMTGNVELYTLAENRQLFYADRGPGEIYDIAKRHLDFAVIRGQVTFSPDVDAVLDPSFLEQ